MDKKLSFLFLFIFLGSLLLPLSGFAGEYFADGTPVCYEGLVPCGKEVWVGGTWDTNLNECTGGSYKVIRCQFCHFLVMLDGIIDFILFKIVPPLAVLMLVIGGIMMMVAHFGGAEMLPGGAKGGPALLGKAKKLMTSVVIGLVIIFAAFIIVNLFFRYIGVSAWTGLERGWFSINCPITLPQ